MKHAYLILCHNDFEQLRLLIESLDDVRNDIFVHVDKKADCDLESFHVYKANLFFIKRRLDCRWGDFSLVEAELMLMEEAFHRNKYSYYHILSGSDLPVKSQDYIHRWCEEYPGVEYIGFSGPDTDKEAAWRVNNYFFFSRDFQSQNLYKRMMRKLCLMAQRLIPIIQKPKGIVYKKGSQWGSDTHNFVGHILSRKDFINKTFKHTYCPDELFLQTLCWNSDFRKNIYNENDEFEGCKRYIKWDKGCLFPMDDKSLKEALKSERWFARKFSSNSDIDLSFLKTER